MEQRVQLCPDGKYRWTISVNMYKNPAVYLTVCKIFAILGGIALVAVYFGPLVRGDYAAVLHDLKYWGIAVLVALAIITLAYLIVALMYGGRYIVNFTMDENGISHEQILEQKKNARKIGAAVAGAGALTGNPGRLGQGAMVASHTAISSEFVRVRSIRVLRRWHTIKINQPFAKNQVYTAPEDFDFVVDYIRSHCPKL